MRRPKSENNSCKLFSHKSMISYSFSSTRHRSRLSIFFRYRDPLSLSQLKLKRIATVLLENLEPMDSFILFYTRLSWKTLTLP